MESSIGQRISEIIHYKRMNPNSFSNKLGTNDSVIRNIIKGKHNPSFELLQKILKAFDDISSDWLITGNGTMLLDENETGIYIKGDNNKIGNEEYDKTTNTKSLEKDNKYLRAKIEKLEELLLIEKDNVIKIQSELIKSLKK